MPVSSGGARVHAEGMTHLYAQFQFASFAPPAHCSIDSRQFQTLSLNRDRLHSPRANLSPSEQLRNSLQLSNRRRQALPGERRQILIHVVLRIHQARRARALRMTLRNTPGAKSI